MFPTVPAPLITIWMEPCFSCCSTSFSPPNWLLGKIATVIVPCDSVFTRSAKRCAPRPTGSVAGSVCAIRIVTCLSGASAGPARSVPAMAMDPIRRLAACMSVSPPDFLVGCPERDSWQCYEPPAQETSSHGRARTAQTVDNRASRGGPGAAQRRIRCGGDAGGHADPGGAGPARRRAGGVPLRAEPADHLVGGARHLSVRLAD